MNQPRRGFAYEPSPSGLGEHGRAGANFAMAFTMRLNILNFVPMGAQHAAPLRSQIAYFSSMTSS